MTVPNATTITFEDVCTTFGENHIHNKLSFSLHQGEVTTLLGPSGAGKTIILKLIMGLIPVQQGTIKVLGNTVSTLEESALRALRSEVAMLFQGAALFDSLTVFENIAYGLRERGETNYKKLRSVVEEKLSLVGLPDVGSKYPSQLSGGQKKRIGLARALASEPKIMLYDEPTTGLDPTSTRKIDDLIVRFSKEANITSLVVTHDIQSASRISDRWMLLSKGKICADGRAKHLAEESALVSQFITGTWNEEL